MSLPHHQAPSDDSPLRKLFEEQKAGTADRRWPNGRLCGKDDGEITFEVSASPNLVSIEFANPVTWVAMTPEDAVKLAQLLIRQARSVSTEPLRIILN